MSVDSVLYRHWQARAEEAEAEVERLRATAALAEALRERAR